MRKSKHITRHPFQGPVKQEPQGYETRQQSEIPINERGMESKKAAPPPPDAQAIAAALHSFAEQDDHQVINTISKQTSSDTQPLVRTKRSGLLQNRAETHQPPQQEQHPRDDEQQKRDYYAQTPQGHQSASRNVGSILGEALKTKKTSSDNTLRQEPPGQKAQKQAKMKEVVDEKSPPSPPLPSPPKKIYPKHVNTRKHAQKAKTKTESEPNISSESKINTKDVKVTISKQKHAPKPDKARIANKRSQDVSNETHQLNNKQKKDVRLNTKPIKIAYKNGSKNLEQAQNKKTLRPSHISTTQHERSERPAARHKAPQNPELQSLPSENLAEPHPLFDKDPSPHPSDPSPHRSNNVSPQLSQTSEEVVPYFSGMAQTDTRDRTFPSTSQLDAGIQEEAGIQEDAGIQEYEPFDWQPEADDYDILPFQNAASHTSVTSPPSHREQNEKPLSDFSNTKGPQQNIYSETSLSRFNGASALGASQENFSTQSKQKSLSSYQTSRPSVGHQGHDISNHHHSLHNDNIINRADTQLTHNGGKNGAHNGNSHTTFQSDITAPIPSQFSSPQLPRDAINVSDVKSASPISKLAFPPTSRIPLEGLQSSSALSQNSFHEHSRQDASSKNLLPAPSSQTSLNDHPMFDPAGLPHQTAPSFLKPKPEKKQKRKPTKTIDLQTKEAQKKSEEKSKKDVKAKFTKDEMRKRKAFRAYFGLRPGWTLLPILTGLSVVSSQVRYDQFVGFTVLSEQFFLLGLALMVLGVAIRFVKFKKTEEDKLDQWVTEDLKELEKRAINMLGVSQRSSLIDPIILLGLADLDADKSFYYKGLYGRDSILRYTPRAVMVLCFSIDKAYIYEGALDLTTGHRVYEHMHEFYYRDISSIGLKRVSSRPKWYSPSRYAFLLTPWKWNVIDGFAQLFAGRTFETDHSDQVKEFLQILLVDGNKIQLVLRDNRIVSDASCEEIPFTTDNRIIKAIQEFVMTRKNDQIKSTLPHF